MKKIGLEGEEIAVKFLKIKGFKILERNYKLAFGEIDIIAKDKETTVFIEVKTRKNKVFGEPFESVDIKKQEKLRKLAICYIKNKNLISPARFDVISILYNKANPEITYIINAF